MKVLKYHITPKKKNYESSNHLDYQNFWYSIYMQQNEFTSSYILNRARFNNLNNKLELN